MEDVLDELEPYFDELGFDPELEEKKIRKLFDVFNSDFIHNPFKVYDTNVSIKAVNSKHTGQPLYFREFLHDFVHTITRTGNINKKRCFEPERANRIHWIKPILLNCDDRRIKKYQFEENDGKIRDYFWFEEKDYVVVLEKILPDYWLITAHVVDDKRKHQKRLWAYIEANKKR